MEYNFREVEKNWQDYWAKNKTFAAKNDSDKPKYYVLDMFPYPSGAGLHVGHPLGYIASDIFARYKRLKGFNVLHPMGYDSFGLPAEQYAIQTGQHPEITTKTNIARYREQLDKIGFSFDWDREVRTSNPDYYKWTQWIFIQLFNSWYNPETNKAENISTLIEKFKVQSSKFKVGSAEKKYEELSEKEQSDVLLEYRLAYLSNTMVNWCPQLGTVLANEEVKDGVSERGGYPVERKLMKQWSLRITAYADRLLNDLEGIDWTESIKEAQRNWIGKSEGTSLTFKVENSDDVIEVFTTRPDTIFGVSFVTLAPEHELVSKLTTPEQKNAVDEYITFAKNRSERERMADVKKITGVFTGAYVLHPFTGKQIPIWLGDYVLAGYGTGAIMAVPGHDSRDYAFAKHFELPIIEVVAGGDLSKESYDAKEGKLINSDFLNGLEVKAAVKKAIEKIEEKGLGKGKTNFRLRDAIFGRQRYWGEPIPVYYENGIPKVLAENELPLILPEVDKYLPTETGEPPLARATGWKYKKHTPGPSQEGNGCEYEYSTMPGWAGSSWYFLRYMDAHNSTEFVSKKAVDYWQNVDLYIGGAEHATGHLLYVRFWTKFLNDLGLIPVTEPAKKLINQGMIQGVSSFVYRLVPVIEAKGDRDKGDKISNALRENLILVSKNRSELFNTGYGDYDWKDEELNKYLTEKEAKVRKEIDELEAKITYMYSALHVDVNIVSNNILDQNAFRNWREEYKNAILLTEENGDYICGNAVEKMSKSLWNVVSPDLMVEQYGADALRLYEMFLGPLELSKPWNTNGITGVSNFIRKLWRLYHIPSTNNEQQTPNFSVSDEPAVKPELKVLHKTIKKIISDIEGFSFNTSVSNFMICVNELTELKCNKREILEPLAIIIAPYAPHIAEELWSKLGHSESITYAAFPECKEEYLVESAFNYPVSFNGKTRFFQEYDLSLSKEAIEKEVLALEQTQKYLEGKTPKKIIVVHNKIVNIVV
ncbi:MAG: leucyl-tRNA synthetase [Bacteroidetes bacterium]|nr:leucyl-tRNA synthetase [Bacteroidota bacterium]